MAASAGASSSTNTERLPLVSHPINYGTDAASRTYVNLSGGAGAPSGNPAGSPRGPGEPQVTISQAMLEQLMAMAARNSVPAQSQETILSFSNGDTYEGTVKDGRPHGKGIMKYASNHPRKYQRFEGFFQNGLMHRGLMKYKNESIFDRYEGEFENDRPHGEGKVFFKNGNVWTGHVTEGKVTGRGVFQWANGMLYEGMMVNSSAHGQGILKEPDGKVRSGNFANGHLEGKGKMIAVTSKGQIMTWDGIFRNGELWNGGFYDPSGYNQVVRNGRSFYGDPIAYEERERRQNLVAVPPAERRLRDECNCTLL